jgi:VWFA-related protein
MVAQLAMKAGRRRIDVLLHESIPAPMTCGVMRPAILLPLDAPAWPGDELRRAMVHELQHIRRGDWLTQCVAHGVCALYWFHPLVWMAKGRLALEAERACDDVVLQESEATSYADQLVTLAQRLSMAASRPMVGMATTTHFATRIRAVLNPAQRRGYVGAGWVTVAVVSAVVVVAAVAPIRAVAAAPRAERVMNELLSVESTAVHREAVETRAVRDSRPQPSAPPIPAVERPRRESAIASSQAAAANPLAAREPVLRAQDGAVSSQSNTRRMSVLLFDVTSLSPEDLQQIAAQATRLVDLTKGPDMAAVVSVGSRLQVIADFTNDREALINAIQSLSVSQDKPAVVQVTPPASESLVTSLGSVAPASLSALSNDHLRAVATLCQVLAPMRDRKGIVFFNAGIPDDNVPEAELRSATNVCSRANVAVYPVDARGFSVGVRF